MLDPDDNDLLRELTPRELELVLPLLRRQEFAAGETILRAGEPGDCLWVIESGVVCVAVPDQAGATSVVAQLGPGQVFGELAILTGQPRSAEIRALAATVAHALSVAAFFDTVGRSPTLLLNVTRVLAGRFGQMTRATSHRDRRALVALVGPTPSLVGSVIATNLAAALAFVSGRRTMLVDLPSGRAASLPGRELAPNLEDIQLGDEALAHLSELVIGPIKLHVACLPDSELPERGGVVRIAGGLARLARGVDLVVVNLTGPLGALADRVLPLASRVCLVAPHSRLHGDGAAAVAERCRRLLAPSAALDVIVLSDAGASPMAVRDEARAALDVPACVVLPGQAELLREAALVEPPMVLHAPGRPISKALTRQARDMAGLRVGLALGAGASRGVAHVGVVEALERLDVPIDVVAGTSIGALVGAGVAMGMELPQIDRTIDHLLDIWNKGLKKVWVPSYSRYDPGILESIVRELAGDVRFEELPVPFGTVATDLQTGRAVHIRRGSVAFAIRASINIPLAFPPLFVAGHVLVDGFLSNPVPTELARRLGADIVLACNLSRTSEASDRSPLDLEESHSGEDAAQKARNIVDMTLRSLEVSAAGQAERDCLSADLTFHPRLPEMGWDKFQKGGIPVRAGKEAVEERLESLRELLPWLRHSR